MQKTPVIFLVGAVVLGLIGYFSWPDGPTTPPSPTEIALSHREDAEFKADRKAWIEQMHRAAPGVDWKARDAATRWRKAQERFDRLNELRGVSPDDFPKDIIGGNIEAHWREVGSQNQAGRIHLAEYDTLTGEMYLASSGGNIWKGTLQGEDWEVKNDFFQLKGIQFMRKHYLDGGGTRLIIGTTDWNLNPVYYSDDDGLSWIPATGLGGPANGGRGLRMVQMADSSQTLWLLTFEWASGGRGCLYRSDDHGQSFTLADCFNQNAFGNTNQMDIWTDKDTPGPLYMLRGDELLVRENNGTWALEGTIIFSDQKLIPS
ncbi:MAG: sialidase family protein [Bacteroidota bacterium]